MRVDVVGGRRIAGVACVQGVQGGPEPPGGPELSDARLLSPPRAP